MFESQNVTNHIRIERDVYERPDSTRAHSTCARRELEQINTDHKYSTEQMCECVYLGLGGGCWAKYGIRLNVRKIVS